ncbi:MAG: NAD(P)/FAD-dependent oxidoreductase [Byssovorax sp.]
MERSDTASVVVIGGGPAGCTAATLLKQARPGARIVLVERMVFPRQHVGESLLPDSNPVLARLGVLDKVNAAGFQRKGGITFKWRTDQPIFSEWFATGVNDQLHPAGGEHVLDHTWQVDRSRYDQILLEHAASLGVEVLQPASVVDVLREGARVTGVVVDVGGERRTLRSEFVVDCSGQARLLGRALGLRTVEHNLGDLAIHRYYEGAGWARELLGEQELSKIFFAAAPAGWVWYIPLSPTRVSVGVVTRKELLVGRDLDQVFEQQLATVPEMTALLASAELIDPPSGLPGGRRTLTTSNWSYAHERAAGPGWYLAGDAAAFVDPVLSSGVTLAHHAGMWAANAIQTEWDHPEISPETLHAEYSQVYEDARAGFGIMAEWWYHHRQTASDDWWQQAGGLMRDRGVRGATGMDDVTAFMHLVAGYLTDQRFTHVGVGFGTAGMSVVAGGMSGKDVTAAAYGEVDDALPVLRAWDRCQPDWYLGTFVETNRWWRLPMLRFTSDGKERIYRPTVHRDASGAPDVGPTVAAIESVLSTLEATSAFGDLAGDIRRRGQGKELGTLARAVVQDLVRLKLLVPGEAPMRLRESATNAGDRGRILKRAFSKAAPTPREDISFADEPPSFTLVTFTIVGAPRSYRPRPGELAYVKALLDACDGRRSVEEVVREASRRIGPPDSREVHDAVNVLVTDLLHLGALTA